MLSPNSTFKRRSDMFLTIYWGGQQSGEHVRTLKKSDPCAETTDVLEIGIISFRIPDIISFPKMYRFTNLHINPMKLHSEPD